MTVEYTCPIWGTPVRVVKKGGGTTIYESPRAGGMFKISGSAEATIENWGQEHASDRVKLSQQIVEHQFNDSVIEITSYNLNHLLNLNHWSVIERADWLLKFISVKSPIIGLEIELLNTTACPSMAWSGSISSKEVVYLLNLLGDKNLIHYSTVMSGARRVTILPEGYAYLEKNVKNQLSDQAFVAMWFDDTVQDAYEKGMDVAIRKAGYKPLRIDLVEHNNKICDEIVANIKRSRFVVSDFTCGQYETTEINEETGKAVLRSEPRGGVYFEAGLAQGLGIPVIWTCRNDMIDQVHFDTRQYNHIVWSSPEDLAEKLQVRIEAVIGDGPLKNQ